jgi:hypothetical protein
MERIVLLVAMAIATPAMAESCDFLSVTETLNMQIAADASARAETVLTTSGLMEIVRTRDGQVAGMVPFVAHSAPPKGIRMKDGSCLPM